MAAQACLTEGFTAAAVPAYAPDGCTPSLIGRDAPQGSLYMYSYYCTCKIYATSKYAVCLAR